MKILLLPLLVSLLPISIGASFVQRKETNSVISMAAATVGEEVGQMYGGIVFLKSTDRKSLVQFYKNRVGMSAWLEQPNISILAHGNMLLGFHQTSECPDLSGMYTFVYPSKGQVDEMYDQLKDIADKPPRLNERYQIYQFFAVDPEGRQLEFQAFLHPLAVVTSQP